MLARRQRLHASPLAASDWRAAWRWPGRPSGAKILVGHGRRKTCCRPPQPTVRRSGRSANAALAPIDFAGVIKMAEMESAFVVELLLVDCRSGESVFAAEAQIMGLYSAIVEMERADDQSDRKSRAVCAPPASGAPK